MAATTARILVPLDGSRLAESALVPATEMAAARRAHITLLHVLEEHPPETIHGEPHLTDLAEAQAYLEGVAATLRARGVVVDVHAHGPGVRDVAEWLARHAEELGADFVVLCSHGSGGWRDFLLGNIAQQTLQRCTRPVLLVSKPTSEGGPSLAHRPWIVALEPVTHGFDALPFVADLSRALHSPVRLLTVVPTRTTLPLERRSEARLAPQTVSGVLEMEARDAAQYLEEVAAGLRKESAAVSVELVRGDPVRQVLKAVAHDDAALLIVTTHTKAGIVGLVGGSFAASVVGRTNCPILLVPIPRRN